MNNTLLADLTDLLKKQTPVILLVMVSPTSRYAGAGL